MRLDTTELLVYLLSVSFSLSELDDLAAACGVEMEHVPERGDDVKTQARALVRLMARSNRLKHLVVMAAKKRPGVQDIQDLKTDMLGAEE